MGGLEEKNEEEKWMRKKERRGTKGRQRRIVGDKGSHHGGKRLMGELEKERGG